MKLDPEVVADESAQWLWYPDEAEVIHTDEFLLVKWPDWFAVPPALLRFAPTRAVGHAFARAADAVRDWGHVELVAWAKLDAPDGFEELLRERGTLDETLDVFALDLSAGVPALDVPEDLEIAWREDLTSSRDFVAVGMAAFDEGTMPTDDVLLAHARESEQDRIAGRGGQMVVRRAGESIGAAGLAMAGSTARLWGGGVVPSARGQGAYRALLAARLEYAVAHGAEMALVKGRVETSGPILRRVGFESYGQERSYVVPVAASGLD